jgi:hypothetical protein
VARVVRATSPASINRCRASSVARSTTSSRTGARGSDCPGPK